MTDETDLSSRRDQADEINNGDFLEFITSEIHDIHQETTRPGWTIWALSGAIGTIIYLILGILGSHSPLYAATVKWFLGFLFAGIGLYVIFTRMNSPFRIDEHQPRYHLTIDFLTKRRASFLFRIAVSALVLFLLFQTRGAISDALLVVAIIITAGILLSYALMLVLSMMAYPLTSSGSWRGVQVSSIAFGLAGLWVGYGYITNLLDLGMTTSSFEDLKIAVLIVILLGLLDTLLNLGQEPPLLRSLREIRRGLFLAKFDLASAIRQADLAIKGLRVGDVLQSDVDLFLSLSRRFNELTSESMEKLSIIESILKSPETAEKKDWSGQIEIINSLLDSIEIKNEGARDLQDQISQVIHGIGRKANILVAGGREAKDELLEIMEMMLQENKLNQEISNTFMAALDGCRSNFIRMIEA